MIRFFHLHIPVWGVLLFAADLVLAFAVISLGFNFSYAPVDELTDVVGVQLTGKIVFTLGIVLSLFVMGLHYRRYVADLRMALLRVAAAHVVAFVLLSTIFYLVPTVRVWQSALLPAMGLSLIGTYLLRVGFVRLGNIQLFKRRIIVLGTAAPAAEVLALERSGLSGRFRSVGFVAAEDEENLINCDKTIRLCSDEPLFAVAARMSAQEIVVALKERRSRLPIDELLQCRLHGIQVSQFSTFMERETGKVELESLNPSWLIFADGFSATLRAQSILKRGFDIVVSLLLLLFTFPVTALAALAIVACDGGPVFYRQDRVGQHSAPFKLLKFRSMRVDAEKDGVARWATLADSRVTAVGHFIRRTRIDEIPQIYNVLRGEMSFVGPRPERPSIVENLRREIPYYDARHVVKPGITGWAQINYSYGASLEDARQKLKYDLYYIKNYSIILDLLILMQTVRVVLLGQGAR
ncbi:MAG: sugar transferase [Alphaproteobacteria bacterium]|nr:MAG: sugar transferase [Alphaproteobacteria bacterium]